MARLFAVLALALSVLAPARVGWAGSESGARSLENRVWGNFWLEAETEPADGAQLRETASETLLILYDLASGSGLFLQRDPAGYLDSVNLYAGFANDPVNNRDPSGETVEEERALAECLAEWAGYPSLEQRCRDENPITPASWAEWAYRNATAPWRWFWGTTPGEAIAEADAALRERAARAGGEAADAMGSRVRRDGIDYRMSDAEVHQRGRQVGASAYSSAREVVTGALSGKAIEIAGSVFFVAAVRVNVRSLPVLRFRRSQLPELAENIEHAQRAGHPTILTYAGGGEALRNANRNAALRGLPSAGRGFSWDEYPFASTREGGAGAWVGAVREAQQNSQGGLISAFVKRYGLKAGDQFVVEVVP